MSAALTALKAAPAPDVTDKPLVPPSAVARAHALGWIPFGFGPRFYVALLLGLFWLVPAWRFPRMIQAMFVWDFFILAAWLWDLLRLPAADKLEIRRIWRTRPALAVPSEVSIEIKNFSMISMLTSLGTARAGRVRQMRRISSLSAAGSRSRSQSHAARMKKSHTNIA